MRGNLRVRTECDDWNERDAALLEAANYYEEATKSRDADIQALACFNLGQMYINGDGVFTDLHQAERLMLRAAKAGDKDAMEVLEHHVYGNEISPLYNMEKARRWRERIAKS